MRYPLDALATVLNITLSQHGRPADHDQQPHGWAALAERLDLPNDMPGDTPQQRHQQAIRHLRYRHQTGLDFWTADTWATRIGHHPSSIWPHWNDDQLDQQHDVA
jgi:hypothetical protein